MTPNSQPDSAPVLQQRITRPEISALHTQIRSYYSDLQRVAIALLYEMARRHPGTSGGNTCAKLLLGLYNGRRFPFDLTDLRLLDATHLEAALTVLRMDAERTYCEVHDLLDAIYADGRYTGHEIELWAWNLRLKNRCTKEGAKELQERVAGRLQ
jgi:hypothetical protein